MTSANESPEQEGITIFLVKAALIAAIYAAVTIAIAPIAFGPLQFRISDALMPLPYLPYFGWAGAIGLTLGVLISNLVSPYGIFDIVLGTLANFLGGLGAYYSRKIKNKFFAKVLAVLIPTLVITFLIGYVLLVLIVGAPLLISVVGVFGSELIIIGIIGYILIDHLEKMLGETQ